MKRMIWLMVCIICLMALPEMTSAHAYLKQSNPSVNTMLETSPKNISLVFSEPIQPAFHHVEVFSEDGKAELDESFIPDDNETQLIAKLKQDLGKGVYTIKWRVISSDGHPIEGTIPFTIGKEFVTKDDAEDDASVYFPGLDKILIQGMQYLSFSLLIGFLFFHLWLYPRKKTSYNSRFSGIIWIAFTLLTLSILFSLPLQTTTDAEVGWNRVFKISLLKETIFHTTFGTIWMIEMGLLVILFSSLLLTKKAISAAYGSFLLIAALILCKASIGHTAAVNNQVLAVIMDFFHLLGMALWLGTLLALVILLPGESKKGKDHSIYWQTIQRFSAFAIVFVLILLVTGIYSSVQHVSSIQSLVTTSYGKVLIGKILLMLIMIGMGAYHSFRGKCKEKKLGPSVLIEFSIGLIIIMLAALLTNLPTANSHEIDNSQVVTIENYQISLELTPSQTGVNEMKVQLSKKNGDIPDIEQITGTLVSSNMNMGEGNIELKKKESGTYTAEPIISMDGSWKLSIHVLTKEYDSFDADFPITISKPK
ncbi:copper resistance protein CopC [Peribacillus sp. FSL H8-0477]|uniref:copper resistance protein CopC n=1 Tax=Peribacillus sp. FSL H8-0477 TaxID=2921388 RepID=UPI0030F4C6D1